MAIYTGYAINVLLTNGDIFTNNYATKESALIAWRKLENNRLVVHASLHDETDAKLYAIDWAGEGW